MNTRSHRDRRGFGRSYGIHGHALLSARAGESNDVAANKGTFYAAMASGLRAASEIVQELG